MKLIQYYLLNVKFLIFIMTEEGSIIIKAIDKDVVNQICSGQVIVSLAGAVKELVENSIDANATSIQIKLKEYGSEIIEVTDNGHGVEEKNFQALTLKHYTSKIEDFADVASVETFGFRGEALSSLCTLSKVSITTKHKGSASGTKLKFDHNGIIIESCKTARQTGTSVVLENIFCTIPVRYKEFLKNLKKEFTKMCSVIYAYGLLSKGVSISCYNQVSNKKLPIMETKGETLKSNVIQIFGAKQSQNLLEIVTCKLDDLNMEEFPTASKQALSKSLKEIELEGFVSSCAHGCGRNSPDRQFYYINSRPIDNNKVSKLVNDIYHQYNVHQYPFIILNMKIVMKNVDINVTPDKRLILMKNEKLLHSIIEASLHKLFQNIPSVLKLHNIGLISSNIDSQTEKNREEEDKGSNPLEKLKKFYSSTHCQVSQKTDEKKSARKSSKSRSESLMNNSVKSMFTRLESPVLNSNSDVCRMSGSSEIVNISRDKDEELKLICSEIEVEDKEGTEKVGDREEGSIVLKEIYSEPLSLNKRKTTEVDDQSQEKETFLEVEASKRPKIDDGLSETSKTARQSVTLNLSMNGIKKQFNDMHIKPAVDYPLSVKFYARINPSENNNAERELERELKKESFKKMEILGQYNLGFIITKLGPDVFIIDQHASDEKYNFENLQQNTKIQTQKLVIPEKLNLTIEKEELLLQNSDIIRRNGFDFIFDENEGPTNRVKLTSVPFSKNLTFGKDDIDEMLFMLENAPNGKMCRPSRVRDMFASRACRKSVMIGTPLNALEMRTLVNHMGEIEQPWNCPHGRPTIRHLINLNMVRI